MRIIDYLDSLNWTQTRLAQEAKVSTSTVQRLVQAKPISRQNADKICDALTLAMGHKVNLHDVNEIHTTRAERPERRKHPQEAQNHGQWLTHQPQQEAHKSPGSEDQNQGDNAG